MRAALSLVIMLGGVAAAQTGMLRPIDAFPIRDDGLAIRRHVEVGKPFTVAGTRGVMPGQQEGTFEAWVSPVKLFSHFTIRADVEGYSVPIDLNGDRKSVV